MLVAEKLFLLLRRDDGKAESALAMNAYGLTGAVITDLILAEKVTVSEEKDPKLTVVSAKPTGNPVLDPALERLRAKDGKRLSTLVADGKLNPEERVAQSLADAGVLDIEEKRGLGLIPAKYPVKNPAPERELRDRLRTVLAGGTPAAGEGPILAILQGLDLVNKVLEEEKGTLSKKELKERIKQVSEEDVVGPAVTAAIQAISAALMTAVIIPVVVIPGT